MDIPIAPPPSSLPHLLFTASVSTVAALAVLVILNVFYQSTAKNRNEPPVVFHWFPFLGNTVSYGINPYNFFISCQEKVR